VKQPTNTPKPPLFKEVVPVNSGKPEKGKEKGDESPKRRAAFLSPLVRKALSSKGGIDLYG
jgi:hypothetical protein